MAGSALKRSFSRVYPQFRAQDLFALVADIESYPFFVPGCQKTRVVSRRENCWLVENVFGFGPLRHNFVSRAILNPPNDLSIASEDGVWRRFLLHWRFEPAGTGCLLTYEMTIEFSSDFLNAGASFAAAGMEQRIMAAFERRAEKLFGRGANEWGRKL
jgi:coenzyme Q-binding protein COQ10